MRTTSELSCTYLAGGRFPAKLSEPRYIAQFQSDLRLLLTTLRLSNTSRKTKFRPHFEGEICKALLAFLCPTALTSDLGS